MLIDTHCHINMMIKKEFDTPLEPYQLPHAARIVQEALQAQVSTIINVGTSLIESKNSVELAKNFSSVYAAIGIHPNDCTETWHHDFKEMKKWWFDNDKKHLSYKIVAIGECGIDRHYPGYHLARQQDAFKAQIELALEHQLAVIVHTRDAADETLEILQLYKKEPLRGVIHCFSETAEFAQEVLNQGFVLGIGGTLTYPKNEYLRNIFTNIPLTSIVLETDAPFLPIQSMRGQQNHPRYIVEVAQYLSSLRKEELDAIIQTTTETSRSLFNL